MTDAPIAAEFGDKAVMLGPTGADLAENCCALASGVSVNGAIVASKNATVPIILLVCLLIFPPFELILSFQVPSA